MLDIQQAFQMNPTSYRYRKLTGSGTVKLVLVKGEAKVSDNAESENDRRKRLRLKARKMMFNEKGVPYAPWMVRQIDEEVFYDLYIIKKKVLSSHHLQQDMIDLLIKKETGESRFKKSSRSNDGTEMEASGGLKWRKAANQVELSWITSLESGNQGFIVEKRPIVSSDFAVVDSYTKNSQLISRGASGGR